MKARDLRLALIVSNPTSQNSDSTIEISLKVFQNVLQEPHSCSSQTLLSAYLDIVGTVMHTWPLVQKCHIWNFNTRESICAWGQALRQNHSDTNVKYCLL